MPLFFVRPLDSHRSRGRTLLREDLPSYGGVSLLLLGAPQHCMQTFRIFWPSRSRRRPVGQGDGPTRRGTSNGVVQSQSLQVVGASCLHAGCPAQAALTTGAIPGTNELPPHSACWVAVERDGRGPLADPSPQFLARRFHGQQPITAEPALRDVSGSGLVTTSARGHSSVPHAGGIGADEGKMQSCGISTACSPHSPVAIRPRKQLPRLR